MSPLKNGLIVNNVDLIPMHLCPIFLVSCREIGLKSVFGMVLLVKKDDLMVQ